LKQQLQSIHVDHR